MDCYYEHVNVARRKIADSLLVFYSCCKSYDVILLFNFQILKSSTPTISMNTKILDWWSSFIQMDCFLNKQNIDQDDLIGKMLAELWRLTPFWPLEYEVI